MSIRNIITAFVHTLIEPRACPSLGAKGETQIEGAEVSPTYSDGEMAEFMNQIRKWDGDYQ